jgi:hypothetical protein
MRLFDAGPFHAGFGIIVGPDEDTIDVCLAAREHGDPLPFRHSLAATLYGDQLRAEAPPGPDDVASLLTLLEGLAAQPGASAGAGRKRRGGPSAPPRKPSKPRR